MALEKISISTIADQFKRPKTGTYGYGSPPGYNLVRGIIASKDITRVLSFQFNPTDLQINKRNVYEYRKYTGKSKAESIWISGDLQTINFTLFMDATAGSNNQVFRKPVNFSPFGEEQTATLHSDVGTLDQVQLLQSFMYPEADEPNSARFIRGVDTPVKQFKAPPDVIFVYGYLFMEAKLTELDIKHQLFNKELVPIRSTADVTLTISDAQTINTNIDFAANPGNIVGPTIPPQI